MTDQGNAALVRKASHPPTRAEVAKMRQLAVKLIAANDRRNPTSENATLAEEDAIFNLRWYMNTVAKECNGGR